MNAVRDLCVQEHRCRACNGNGCASCDDGHNHRRAADGLRLCASCRRHLEKLIGELPARYRQLEACLTVTGTSGQRVSGSATAALPVNTAVAEHRDQIRHDLVWWCVYTADAQKLIGPGRSEPSATAPWLASNADWLAKDLVAAGECLPVMRALNGRAWALIDPDGAKRITIGPCAECGGGTLYATVRAEDDPRPSLVYCDECELELTAERWLRFGNTYRKRMAS